MLSKDNPLNQKIQTALLGLISTVLVGCFSFLWNTNKTVAIIQEQLVQKNLRIDIVQQGVNDLRLDQNATKQKVDKINDAVIRIEEHQNNAGK